MVNPTPIRSRSAAGLGDLRGEIRHLERQLELRRQHSSELARKVVSLREALALIACIPNEGEIEHLIRRAIEDAGPRAGIRVVGEHD